MSKGKRFAPRSPRQGTEITERSPWFPLCALSSHGSTIPCMKGSVNQGFITLLMFLNKRLRSSPDVAPYQRLREGPAGNTAKQKYKKSTFKAGMCMKTNKTRTKCPEKIRHFCLSFGHFRLTDTNFAEKCGFVVTICQLNLESQRKSPSAQTKMTHRRQVYSNVAPPSWRLNAGG